MNEINTKSEILKRMRGTGLIRAEKSIEKARQSTKNVQPIRSALINPYHRFFHHKKGVIEPQKKISYRTLRRVAEKAWLINTIINHQTRQILPYLKPSTEDDSRGYQIVMKDEEQKPASKDKKEIKYLEQFIYNTGEKDNDREDNLIKYSSKLLRDLHTLDQVTSEMQRTRAGNLYAFWYVDPATIFKVDEEGYDGDDRIKYIQEIDMILTAKYTANDLIFDYQNARSDVDYYGYGYSNTEQAIELITGLINTFSFNASVFTEDHLPRGMILLGGDADLEDVEAIEEYIISVMSGGPMSKWRIPIVPSGVDGKNKADNKLEWISFQKNNQEMQFSQWTEFLWTAAAALYGTDLEELGIKTQKSTSLLGENVEPKIQESKSRALASNLSFLAGHYNKIIDFIEPKYKLKFTGHLKDDVKLKNATTESQLRTWKSIDKICAENDEKPYNKPWSKIPLNPHVIQIIQASMGMQGMGGQEGNGEFPGEENGEKGQGEESFEKQYEKMQGETEEKKSVKKAMDETIEIIIK